MSVSENEVSEMMNYLGGNSEVSGEKVRQAFSAVYKEAKPLPPMAASFSREDFESALQRATQPERVEEELLYLFFQLDKDRYL
jgi:hypothetical protein